jgi:DNA-directed RNA polymerase specialized sigma24 family protein
MAIARHKTRQRELRDERALTRRVQRGDRKAFELLYASHEGRLYRVCYRLTGSSVSAAALVEATFTRALADLPEGDLGTLDFAGHLYGTARTLAYERHTNGGPPELDAAAEQVRDVGAAGRRIAPRQRMTLALRDLEGRPDAEIADALGCDEATVAALVARARLRLRAELQLPEAFAACDARLPELSAYSDGTLPQEARPGIESHVEECAHCRAALFALREARLRYRSLPTPIPPGELGTRMAVALDAVGLAPLRPPAAAADGAAGAGGRQTAAAVAMAALVVVGAGVTIAAWRSEPSGSKPSHLPPSAAVPGTHATAAAGAGTLTSLAAGGRQAPVALPAAPPVLHHLRTGPRRPPRIVPGPPPNAAAIATSSPAPPASSASRPASPPAPAKTVQPAPPTPVQILPPAAPPATARPAAESSGGPRPVPQPDPPQPEQTTTT